MVILKFYSLSKNFLMYCKKIKRNYQIIECLSHFCYTCNKILVFISYREIL